jgi:hypothetical protein
VLRFGTSAASFAQVRLLFSPTSPSIKPTCFVQVLLYLPLALDVAGKECLLALSLLLSLLFGFNATAYLIVRNTRLRPLSTVISSFVIPFAIPALLLLSLNLYSTDRTSSTTRFPSSSQLSSLWSVVRQAPGWWEWVLRTSSPVFTILEGISTLLCIQAVSRFSVRRIENSRVSGVLLYKEAAMRC